MYEAIDIEHVGPVPGGVEILLRGDYNEAGQRGVRRIEFDHAAVERLLADLERITKAKAVT